MRVLIACEYSGTVREEFRKRGHDAWSADLLDTEIPGQHFKGDLFDEKGRWAIPIETFDLMIAHPPCTHLASSGARWFKDKEVEQRKAIWFFIALATAPVERIAIENPVGVMSRHWKRPDQIVQPYWFGDSFRKTTCLWLKGLPLLRPTNVVDEGESHVTKSGRRLPAWYNLPPSPDRGKIRSKTFPGFARAMADQWG